MHSYVYGSLYGFLEFSFPSIQQSSKQRTSKNVNVGFNIHAALNLFRIVDHVPFVLTFFGFSIVILNKLWSSLQLFLVAMMLYISTMRDIDNDLIHFYLLSFFITHLGKYSLKQFISVLFI